ncbi:Uncharacterized protein APZ42_021719 [Daphnia magna]|uniref:Uncharacterized protein n=1 Tax=Daphnia magna TaxID=35525 RepID=A0A164WGD8_9CRUS|nr:Uncharacterized protein APZ42_021719 [Daphnia magna]
MWLPRPIHSQKKCSCLKKVEGYTRNGLEVG